jgi:5-methylcytosine-specific restriction enzyme subunit McrC
VTRWTGTQSASMRTIRLIEHQTRAERLTPDELQQLLRLVPSLLKISLGSDGLSKLTPGSHVGTIVLPSIRLLISPKAGLRNVFFLLSYTHGIRWRAEDFPYDEDDLFRAIAWWFDRECAAATSLGITRDYIDREAPQTTLRGRLMLGRQLATRPGRHMPIECRFQEYSEDTTLNRTIKAAHNALLRVPELDHSVAARLRHRARQAFSEVEHVEFPATGIAPPIVSRLNRHWESAFHLAEMILRGRSIRDAHGHVLATGFTVDMNKVFERFVQALIAEHTRGTGYLLKAQTEHDLTSPGAADAKLVLPPMRIRPDYVLKHGRSAVAVGDAKYKQKVTVDDAKYKQLSKSRNGRNPDVYQLLAYCVHFNLRRGLLIYAGPLPLTHLAVLNTNLSLAMIGIDLSGSPESILREGRLAAATFVGQADYAARSSEQPASISAKGLIPQTG